MQSSSDHSVPSADAVTRAFAERAKVARNEAGLTQAQLSERLDAVFGIKLDTSAITRIEAGQREPRLSEAFAIAKLLDFGFYNMTPLEADLESHMHGVAKMMDESREILLRLIRSVDPVAEYVKRNPHCLGDDTLDSVFQEQFELFRREIAREPLVREDETLKFAVTNDRADDKLKRELLRVITENLLITSEELKASINPRLAGKPRGERLEPPVIEEQWEQGFKRLLEYVKRNGDARVPRSYIVDGHGLGGWVAAQRAGHAKGTLAPNRARRLEELPGWTWRPRSPR